MIDPWSETANCAAQRRRQRNLAVRHGELRKEPTHLHQADSANVWIRWIVTTKVGPEQPPTRNENAIDFARDATFHVMVQHRREQHELRNEIEAAVRKRKIRGATANDLQAGRRGTRLLNERRKEIDPPQLRRLRLVFKILAKRSASTATDIENPLSGERM